ncbi:MAG: hypothetical protein PHF99_11750, partial [Bacteroidales bacterium]|nr:hypothetical protein [Bacteroidales bacterium]
MKKSIYLLFSLSLICIFANTSFSQPNNYKALKGFDIGLGFGGSYQTSDIRNSRGAGATLFFGHSIYQKENAVFGLDWRFRFLGGQNTAFDDRINLNNKYDNVKYTHYNYDLELVLTLNRFRELTRIILSGFAGVGYTHNLTYFDLQDGNTPYDFSLIDNDASRYSIYNDLKKLSDKDFETKGIRHGCVIPTVGFNIGYQVTPRFSVGFEHKVNFFLNEDDNLVGANIDGKFEPDSRFDRNNYSGIVLKWDIGYGSGTSDPQPPCENPLIDVAIREVNTPNATHQLEGKVYNVENAANITVTVNGIEDNSFYFLANNSTITGSYRFGPGKHNIVISAQNRCGSDSKTYQVIVNAPCYPPVVQFSVFESTHNSKLINVVGTATNLRSSSQISFLIDGVNYRNYEYNTATNEIIAEIELNNGNHDISISAKNECGQDSQSTEISVGGTSNPNLPCDVPIVDFYVSETNQDKFTFDLNGTIQNINDRNEITILVDNRTFNDFEYVDNNNSIKARLYLTEGEHIITVVGRNDCGQDREAYQVNVEETDMPCDPPVVNFSVTNFNKESNTYKLSGLVTNLDSKSQITLAIDGRTTTNFVYLSSNSTISAEFPLKGGKHNISISAKNECGEDSHSYEVNVSDNVSDSETPCLEPEIRITIGESFQTNYTHQLKGTISNVKSKNEIQLLIDGKADNNFAYNTSNGSI